MYKPLAVEGPWHRQLFSTALVTVAWNLPDKRRVDKMRCPRGYWFPASSTTTRFLHNTAINFLSRITDTDAFQDINITTIWDLWWFFQRDSFTGFGAVHILRNAFFGDFWRFPFRGLNPRNPHTGPTAMPQWYNGQSTSASQLRIFVYSCYTQRARWWILTGCRLTYGVNMQLSSSGD